MPRKSRKNVGLIGLGIIGSRVAAGLRQSGFHVFVWNRTAKPAPNFVGSPAEIAEICDIIQLFVADAAALFDVIEQMKDSLGPQHVVICSATVGPEATLEAARVVEETGAHFLDAPFTGSKGAAEKRSLVYYIGGDEATFLRARPVLEATSKAIVRIGGIGHAATVKVVTNMISAVTVQTLGEALAIVQKAGLDPEVLAAALEQNACRSGVVDLKLPKMMSGDYDPHFSLKHMFKDVQLGIHIANALDIEIPATTVTAGVMYGALNQGWGDLDYAALYKIYEPQTAGASAAELQSGFAQIEDLDAKEVHYPDTKVAAPPRPGSEPEPELEPEPLLSVPEPAAKVEEPPKVEAPSLAAALGAPAELTPVENPPAEPAPVAEDPTPKAAEPAPVAAAPEEAPVRPPEPTPPLTQVVIPGHVPVPGVIHLAPVDTAGATVGTVVLTSPEAASAAPAMIPSEKAPEDSAPESGKVVEFPPPRPPEPPADPAPASEARKEEPVPVAPANGNLGDHPEEGGAKPFNFVKRWFVSRSGG